MLYSRMAITNPISSKEFQALTPRQAAITIRSIRRKKNQGDSLTKYEKRLIKPYKSDPASTIQTFKDHSKLLAADYYNWLVDNSQPVEIQSYRDNKKLRTIITAFRKGFTPKVKSCHDTALRCALFSEEIELVVGFLGQSHLVDHSWNCYQNIFFDLTAETVFGHHQHFGGTYLKISSYADRDKILELDELSDALRDDSFILAAHQLATSD